MVLDRLWKNLRENETIKRKERRGGRLKGDGDLGKIGKKRNENRREYVCNGLDLCFDVPNKHEYQI